MTFVCVLRSGGVFTPLWVERLCRDAAKHLKPDRMICMMDGQVPCGGPEAMPSRTAYWQVPLTHNWPGWFSKMELGRPGLFSGPCVYVDLDTLILGPVDFSPVFRRLEQGPERLAMLDDFYRPVIPASGVMAWIPSPETERIYHDFVARPRLSSRWSEGDGFIIGKYPHVRLQRLLPGVFGSLKAHKLNDGPRGFSVVCQHGKPKFPDLPADHWMRRTWEGR